MSTSCGVPSSLLSNVILNGAPAGALTESVSNLTPWATIVIPPGGPPEPGGGSPEAGGPPDAPGDAPGSPPVAARGGNQPWSRTTATTTTIAMAQRSVLGQVGAGPFSVWPVRSASTTWPYSFLASISQPSPVRIVKAIPTHSSQPPNTSPANSNPRPSERRIGRNVGPGTWTPSGGPSWTTTTRWGTASAT